LRTGMRILDLGCGKATSSIFLAREFGAEVWAADGATSPSENRKRAVALGCEASVFPLRVNAHSLPFAKEFFDVVKAPPRRTRPNLLRWRRRRFPDAARSILGDYPGRMLDRARFDRHTR
ncbi:MAG TPA: methyltransferase domain-containing protein, partial [Stellaceae bacterium]|nr:methyltransferase domain-containing protein [Stellaceae bacterium]